MAKDSLDLFIEVLHQLLGHDRCADYLGQPRGDKTQCRLCHPELGPINYDQREEAPT